MICDYFKFSGRGEAVLDVNDLLGVQLKNDHVQGWNISSTQRNWNFSWHCSCRMRYREESLPVMLNWKKRFASMKSRKYWTAMFNARNDDRSLQAAAATGNPRGNPQGPGTDTSKDRKHGEDPVPSPMKREGTRKVTEKEIPKGTDIPVRQESRTSMYAAIIKKAMPKGIRMWSLARTSNAPTLQNPKWMLTGTMQKQHRETESKIFKTGFIHLRKDW